MIKHCQSIWLIDPQNRTVEIYRVGSPVERLENPTELTGDRLLPGFRLDLQRIWGEQAPIMGE
ncbi:Uma2 family endonuclease [Spirulina sp. CCNP1310]|uniref:Uma2 family endonuclease n=1 Tax=Spirulina sp. CCNP1310 TaxID=3110249 RepID=UPI003A4C5E8A